VGSYASLKIGSCIVGDWKSYVSLEPLLMFSPRELVIGTESYGEEEVHATYCFRTNVAAARQRLDDRGIIIDLCRQLFAEYRTDILWKWDPGTGQSLYEPNDVTFEEYRAVLAKHLASRVHRAIPNEEEEAEDGTMDKVTSEGFFVEEFFLYFPDAAFCLDLRVLLEEAASEALVELDLTELVHAGYIDEQTVPNLYDHFFELMLRRIRFDYKIYGFVIEEDPRLRIRLRQLVEALPEDKLIKFILLPLLVRMGFERLRKVEFHGPGEFGADVLPFRHRTPLGTLEYYALQGKAVRIHCSSSQRGNAAEIVNQATQALAVSFVDDLDNTRKHLDRFIVATNKTISANARHFIEEAIEGRRNLLLLDLDRLVELILEHRLAHYVLFSEWEHEEDVG
jgi:hypothetical protein